MSTIKTLDIRRLSKDAQQRLGRQVVAAREEGKTYDEIHALYGVQNATACDWWRRYQAEGEAFFAADRRVRPKASGGRLTPVQCARIRDLITDRMPEQFKLPFAPWTRGAVQRLIEREYGVFLPLRTVGEYFKRWGYTPQRPARRAYEQCSKAVQQWLTEQYPAIAKRARAEGAEIHWGDKTGLRSDHQAGRSYARAGQTPVAEIPAKRVRVQMISTVTHRGTLRFMHDRGAMNSKLLIRFLGHLIADSHTKDLRDPRQPACPSQQARQSLAGGQRRPQARRPQRSARAQRGRCAARPIRGYRASKSGLSACAPTSPTPSSNTQLEHSGILLPD